MAAKATVVETVRPTAPSFTKTYGTAHDSGEEVRQGGQEILGEVAKLLLLLVFKRTYIYTRS
jgi:hypothetical protein